MSRMPAFLLLGAFASSMAACPAPRGPTAGSDALASAQILVGGGPWRLPAWATFLTAHGSGRAVAVLGIYGIAEIDLSNGRVIHWWRPDRRPDNVGGAITVGDSLLVFASDGHRWRSWRVDLTSLAISPVDLPDPPSTEHPLQVALSPDGVHVAVVAHDTVELRDATSLKLLRTVASEPRWENPGFSADGKLLIARQGGKAHVFDVATGREVATWSIDWLYPGPRGLAIAVDLDTLPAKPLLRSYVVETSTGKRVAKLRERRLLPWSVVWSHDGSRVAVDGNEALEVFDVATGTSIVRRIDSRFVVRAFTSDGRRLLATAFGSALQIIDPATGDTSDLGEANVGAAHLAAPHRRGLLTVADTVHIWDDRGRLTATHRSAHGHVVAAVLGRDGRVLATESYDNETTHIETWDLASGRRIGSVAPSHAVVHAVDQNGEIVATVVDRVERIDVNGARRTIRQVHRDTYLTDIDLTADRAVWNRGGQVTVTDASGQRRLARATMPRCNELGWARLARDRPQLATMDNDTVMIWDIASSGMTAAMQVSDGVAKVEMTPGRDEVTVITSRGIVLWEPRARRAAAIDLPGVPADVGWSPDGQRIAIGFADGRAAEWLANDLRALARPYPLGDVEPPPQSCGADPLEEENEEDVDEPDDADEQDDADQDED